MTGSGAPRVGYLGPAGTFSEEAVLASARADEVQCVPLPSIHEAVMAVQEGTVRWSLVPIENSIEGSVTATLDALAGEAGDVTIVGEVVLAVEQCLIVRAPSELDEIETVVSFPHAAGQCARFLRERLPDARVLSASSTADAVRVVAESSEPGWAALGPRLAAERYGCVVLLAGVQDGQENETRFVWLAREAAEAPPVADRSATAAEAAVESGQARPYRTSLLFWGPGDEHPGWLFSCLGEFARRDVNLTRIESRPRRVRLGHYVFFIDLEGRADSPEVSAATDGLREHCQGVRVLGSYPSSG